MEKKKYYRFDANMILMNVLSIVLFIVPFLLLGVFKYSFSLELGKSYYIPVMFLYFWVHELCHGFGYSLFAKNKKNIKYGIALEKGVFYAMCQEKISKKAILISLLMPLVVLSILPLPFALYFHLHYLLILIIMNFGGAIGDMLMTILVLKCPSDIEYIDYDDGIGITLISKNDLSKIKAIGLKVSESGLEKDKKINESIKRFSCSKTSLIIIIAVLILSFLPDIIELISKIVG